MLSRAPDGGTLLETALNHERVVTATLIVVIPLVCWAWIALIAHDMPVVFGGTRLAGCQPDSANFPVTVACELFAERH
jgi:hypothetical protein